MPRRLPPAPHRRLPEDVSPGYVLTGGILLSILTWLSLLAIPPLM